MQFFLPSRTPAVLGALLIAIVGAGVQGALAQDPRAQAREPNETPVREAKGMPPRATPGDYQANAKAGGVTIGAEFKGHSVTTEDSVYSTEDFVVVEIALFGPAGTSLKLSYEDFALRINRKKAPSPAQPYGAVFRSLKDPQWTPPGKAESKSKTGISTGGGSDGSTPAPAHMPIELERAMDQKVRKAALPEGDRTLPEAGLVFFEHRGKESGIHSLELIYSGTAGKATLTLQP
jgi:hypothetical protein